MGYPFIGETLDLITKGANFYRSRRSTYGNVYKTHILGRPTIRVCGSQNIRKILQGEGKLVTSQWPTSTRAIMGTGGVSHAEGKVHKFRREVLTQVFHHDSLEHYVKPIQDVIKESISNWCQKSVVMGFTECKRVTFSIISKVLLGINMTPHDQEQFIQAYHEFLVNLFSLPVDLPGSGLHKGLKARQFIKEKLDKIVNEKRRTLDKCKSEDALTLLLKAQDSNGNRLSQEEITDLCIEFLFAGHLTTSSAICSMILYLAKEQSVVDNISSELFEVNYLYNAQNINQGATLDLDGLNNLQYVGQVVRELLRISPPVGGGYRKALETFELEGYQIPKGWTVAYGIRDTHEAAEIYKGKEVFNPNRWSMQLDLSQEERFTYIPFGGGDRLCIGQEFAKLVLKIFSIELVRNCTWRLQNGTPAMKYLPVPEPVDGLPVEFTEAPAFRPRSLTV